jgi:hypothetical protein
VYSIYNSISFYNIPFKKALHRTEDKESPGVFSLVCERHKARSKKQLIATAFMFM